MYVEAKLGRIGRESHFFIVICEASATTHIHACVRLPLNCKKSAHCQQHEAFNIALILAKCIWRRDGGIRQQH